MEVGSDRGIGDQPTMQGGGICVACLALTPRRSGGCWKRLSTTRWQFSLPPLAVILAATRKDTNHTSRNKWVDTRLKSEVVDQLHSNALAQGKSVDAEHIDRAGSHGFMAEPQQIEAAKVGKRSRPRVLSRETKRNMCA